MTSRALATLPRSVDARSPRRAWLPALVTAVPLASALHTPLTASAAVRPSIVMVTVWTDFSCTDVDGEATCTNVTDVEIPLLTVSEKRFTPYGMVSIQVTRNGVHLVVSGVPAANARGTISLEADVRLCHGSSLPFIMQD